MANKQASAKKTAKKDHTGEIAAVAGAGVLAAAAAGAGFYFYGTKHATQHRKKAAKWTNDMKNEVLKQAKTAKKLDKQAMAVIVDRAARSYQGVRSVNKDDLLRAANELKQNWKEVEAELKRAGNTSTKAVKKAAKTATASPRRAANKVAAKAPAKKSVKKTTK